MIFQKISVRRFTLATLNAVEAAWVAIAADSHKRVAVGGEVDDLLRIQHLTRAYLVAPGAQT